MSLKHKNLPMAVLLRFGKQSGVIRFSQSDKITDAVRKYIIWYMSDILILAYDAMVVGGRNIMRTEDLNRALVALYLPQVDAVVATS